MASSSIVTAAEPPAAPGIARGFGYATALLMIGVVQALALAVSLSQGSVSWVELLTAQAVALGALGLILALAWRAGRDCTFPLLGLIAGTVIGPVGILGAAMLAYAALIRRKPNPLIAAWYERISLSTTVDPETRLCDDVAVGRTLDLAAPIPSAFPTIMEAGPLAARQTVLGLIARQFHPSYLESLKIALRSPEPSIRVQAAAVATEIGPVLRRMFHERIAGVDAGSRDAISALALLGELQSFIDCGLLEAGERQRGIDLAAHLGDRILESVQQRPLSLPYAADPVRAAELEGPLEQLLIARGRFAEFRAHRSTRRIQTRHPTARTRRLGSGRWRAEVTA